MPKLTSEGRRRSFNGLSSKSRKIWSIVCGQLTAVAWSQSGERGVSVFGFHCSCGHTENLLHVLWVVIHHWFLSESLWLCNSGSAAEYSSLERRIHWAWSTSEIMYNSGTKNWVELILWTKGETKKYSIRPTTSGISDSEGRYLAKESVTDSEWGYTLHSWLPPWILRLRLGSQTAVPQFDLSSARQRWVGQAVVFQSCQTAQWYRRR